MDMSTNTSRKKHHHPITLQYRANRRRESRLTVKEENCLVLVLVDMAGFVLAGFESGFDAFIGGVGNASPRDCGSAAEARGLQPETQA